MTNYDGSWTEWETWSRAVDKGDGVAGGLANVRCE